jgi:hypothetical protein
MGETKIEKVRVRLSPTYEMSYKLWTGHTVEEYCKFRVKQSPLNMLNEWVNTVLLLLNETCLINCKICCHNCLINIFGTKLCSSRPYALLCLINAVPWHTRNKKIYGKDKVR